MIEDDGLFYTSEVDNPTLGATINGYCLELLLCITDNSLVFQTSDPLTGEKLVIKLIKRKPNKELRILNEVQLISEFNIDTIIKIRDAFQYMQFYCITMPYAPGGTLYTYIRKYYPNGIPEAICKVMVVSMLETLKQLRKQGVVHRDIKLCNFLVFNTNDQIPLLVLSDFGFATRCIPNGMNEFLGTLSYVAPEILQRRSYSYEVDMWSFGVCVYSMLSGRFPFPQPNNQRARQRVIRGIFSFRSDAWQNVSSDAKDFIRRLLTISQTERMTPKQGLMHPWLRDVAKHSRVEGEVTALINIDADSMFETGY
ncbi:CAMK protein kinase [Histomonas meleagridis]|uniref:CAMK protein kinase n=1 Tax=Histomonas meleagridis TaxID=135588 RepID=UPI0035599860|nr:CAMK protein kinase [Histomonas meleagridis]KAH0799175.1 CAMK protein kinase [Histomonas meleagridis]